jgi:ABC-type xylose transport system permease subunit
VLVITTALVVLHAVTTRTVIGRQIYAVPMLALIRGGQ